MGWEVGHQLDGGSEFTSAAILTRNSNVGDRLRSLGERQVTQKTLNLPRHLVRPLEAIEFAHPTEQDLARVFTFYGVDWVYEPTTFHLDVDEAGRPTEQVCPDFYLPRHDVYVELTTMRQSLVTRKNRKIRRLKEIYPTVRVRLLYRKDYDRLMGSVFGANGHAVNPVPGKSLVTERQLQQRLAGLAAEVVSADRQNSTSVYGWGSAISMNGNATSRHGIRKADESLVLLGLGGGTLRILETLEFELRSLDCRTSSDLLTLSRPDAPDSMSERVCVAHRPSTALDGRDVVIVADVISTGLSALCAIEWCRSQGARRVRLLTLLDRSDARIVDIPVTWTGFRAPDEIVAGFGVAYQNQFADLPGISLLRAPARSRRKPAPEEGPIAS